MTTPTTAPDFTFGVEIELVLASATHASKKDVRALICKALTSAGIPLAVYSEPSDTTYDKWGVKFEGVFLSRDYPDHGSHHGHGLEIVSPVFRYADPGWRAEVAKVLGVVRAGFDGPGKESRVLVNATCGLHVHVGDADGMRDFGVSQRLMQVQLGFERVIGELHSTDRLERNQYARPNSVEFVREYVPPDEVDAEEKAAAKGLGPWDGPQLRAESDPRVAGENALAWCRWVAQHAREIVTWDGQDWTRRPPYMDAWSSKYMWVNFGNLLRRAMGLRSLVAADIATVEFRQHRGSVEADEIAAWVDVTVGMTRFAATTSQTDLDALLRRNVFNPAFTVFRFLKMIGVPANTVGFYRRKLDRSNLIHAYRTTLAGETDPEYRNMVKAAAAHRLWEQDPFHVRLCLYRLVAAGHFGQCPPGFKEKLLARYVRETSGCSQADVLELIQGQATTRPLLEEGKSDFEHQLKYEFRKHKLVLRPEHFPPV